MISEKYATFFKDSFDVFKKTTSYAILLEKIGENKVEIGSINELRSVLYHLYAFMDESESENYEAHRTEAIEHLFRAYFDSFSLLCTLLLERIHGYSSKYGTDIMVQICPDYFGQIIPESYEVLEEISHVRAVREKGGKTPKQKLEKNHAIIVKLLAWNKKLESLRNVLEGKKHTLLETERFSIEEKEKNKKKDLYQKIALVILGAVLGAIAKHFL